MDHFNHFSYVCIERLKKLLIILTLGSVEHPGNKVVNGFSWELKRSWISRKCRSEKKKKSLNGAGVCIRLLDVF